MLTMFCAAFGCSTTAPPKSSEHKVTDNEIQERAALYDELRITFSRYRKHNVATALLSLNPRTKERLSLHLLNFKQEAPFDAEAMARADIQAGNLNVLTGGLSRYSATPGLIEYLASRYTVHVLDIADCTDPKELFQLIEAYNEVSGAEIRRRFGADFFDRIWNEPRNRE